MKIAISATGTDLQAQVDPRFGRAQYFIIYDTGSQQFESVSNEAQFASGGAGIQAGQTVQQAGAQAVLTGNVGPNAIKTLAAAGIKVYTGATGTVHQAVTAYGNGQLQETGGATVDSHSGTR